MAIGVVAHVHGHPRPVGAVLMVFAEQHRFDVVLPRPHVLLVRRQDGAHVVGGAASDGVPGAAFGGGVREGVLGDHLAHGIALALRRSARVGFVWVTIFVEHRAAHVFLHVRFGHHRGDAGGHHHAGDAVGFVHRFDQVVADHLHIVVIGIRTHMRDMGHAVAASEDFVKAAGVVEIGRMQR